jgi:hypothetical protein
MKQKIILISPEFFNLSTLIKGEIERQGNTCLGFSDRPSSSFFDKAMIRFNKNFINHKINRYFATLEERCLEEKPDKIIVIFGQSFTGDMFIPLKAKLPQTEFVFFTWDSVSAYPIIEGKFKVFDRCYSFDSEDCVRYNVRFLPLFYSYQPSLAADSQKESYDYSFLGTIKKGKYPVIRDIVAQLKTHYSKGYIYMFLQSHLVYRYYKLTDKDFRKAKKKDFRYERLDGKTSNAIFEASKIVIDVAMAGQNGLTIRSFDALHLKKKLITNNPNIKKYPFYTPDNILVYEGGPMDFSSPFFTKPFNEDFALSDSYSLKSFVSVLLGETVSQ